MQIPYDRLAYSVADPPPRRFKREIELPDGAGKIKIYIYTTQLVKTKPLRFKLEVI